MESISCLPHEIPRDIAFIDHKARAKMAGIVNKVYCPSVPRVISKDIEHMTTNYVVVIAYNEYKLAIVFITSASALDLTFVLQ